MFHYAANQSFGGSTPLHTVWGEYVISPEFLGDKDRAIRFFVYFNGRLRTYATVEAGSLGSAGNPVATPSFDPPWFSWD